jgi:iron complex transport system substrate-binding protein
MAALDMLDNWGMGDRVVGMPKGSKIDYLMKYNDNADIANLGTLKEVDMEALMGTEPDIIFIGGRLSAQYDALSKVAPVVYLPFDQKGSYMDAFKKNVQTIAQIFGTADKAAEQLSGFDARINALKAKANGQTALVGMVTSANFNTLSSGTHTGLIVNDIGFKNLAPEVEATHGDSASFELLVQLNPEYIFVIDRDSAIAAEGADTAEKVMDNELVAKTQAAKDNHIVYLTPSVWYLATGGISATDTMLKDLEKGLGVN